MSTPLGHTLVSAALYNCFVGMGAAEPGSAPLAAAVVLGNIHDIDYLSVVACRGIHHGPTHSLVFSLAAAGIAVLFFMTAGGMAYGARYAGLFTVCALSHLLVDSFLMRDRSREGEMLEGQMLLYPFSKRFIHSPVNFLPGCFKHGFEPGKSSLFTRAMLRAHIVDILVFGSLFLLSLKSVRGVML